MLGNEHDARFIRDWFSLMHGNSYDYHSRLPGGWQFLGSGCYRLAYLHEATGVVYKVQYGYDRGWGQSNLEEYHTLRRLMLRKAPQGVRFPRYHLHDIDGKPVSAMERLPKLLRDFSYYTPEGMKYREIVRRFCDTFPELWDTHDLNFGVDEAAGQIVPIDLGA